jgi:hypothetical protein
MKLLAWIREVWAAWMDPVDVWPDDDDTFPDSDGWTDRIDPDFAGPTTQPSDWGALKTLPGALDDDLRP